MDQVRNDIRARAVLSIAYAYLVFRKSPYMYQLFGLSLLVDCECSDRTTDQRH